MGLKLFEGGDRVLAASGGKWGVMGSGGLDFLENEGCRGVRGVKSLEVALAKGLFA
jgi:hypothetical protein